MADNTTVYKNKIQKAFSRKSGEIYIFTVW